MIKAQASKKGKRKKISRDKLNQAVAEYLADGGKITTLEVDTRCHPNKPTFAESLFSERVY